MLPSVVLTLGPSKSSIPAGSTDMTLQNNIALPILDSLGAILSISICLLVLRVKIFGSRKPNLNLQELSTLRVRSLPIEATSQDQAQAEIPFPQPCIDEEYGEVLKSRHSIQSNTMDVISNYGGVLVSTEFILIVNLTQPNGYHWDG